MANTTDVAIIGAGPAGLFAAFECGMLKLNCHIIDPLEMVGGQCVALYPEKPIYDIPALPQIKASDLIENLKTQISPFSPTFHLGQQVIKIEEGNDECFTLKTSTGNTIHAKAVIVAAGVGAFGPNRPPVANLEQFEATRSVQYFVKDPQEFMGKDVVIAGGGDSALDWAIYLADIAKSVTLVHRRPKFRAAPDSVEKAENLAKSGRITMAVPYQLDSLQGDCGVLNHVVLKDLDGKTMELKADNFLAFYGLAMELGPIAEWGLNIDRKTILVDQKTCQTNRRGIYAIGDIAHYDSKLKLILTGFAEAAHAAHAIRAQLYPNEAFHFEHSTTMGVPASAVA